MPVNLLNERDFNDYISDVIYRGEKAETYTAGNFKSFGYVVENKDKIIKSMVYQWAKHRLRSYLDEKPEAFLQKVSWSAELPGWAKQALAEKREVWAFKPEKVSAGFRETFCEIQDFLYSMADSYVRKQLGKANGSKNKAAPRLRIDYLKSTNEYDSFEKVKFLSDKWHRMLNEKAEKKQLRPAQDLAEKAAKGTQTVLTFDNGMAISRLLTAEALDFESDCMGHCVGRGSYDTDVLNGRIEIYSLRDQLGNPHATIKIKGTKLRQCKGRGNFPVVDKYIPFIQSFVEARGYEIVNDMKNVGLIKKGERYYNLFDLPKDEDFTIYGDLDLSNMKLEKLPDLSRVSIFGSFDCSSNRLADLSGMPKRAERLLCGNNEIRSLKAVPEGVAAVSCPNNLLSELPVFPENVVELHCGGNRLEKAEVNAPGLKWLDCGNNRIKSIGRLPAGLKIFDCSWNDLEKLENLPENLLVLRCYNNRLKSLGKLPEGLQELDCENNCLKTLKGIPSGVKLKCDGNPLENLSEQMTKLISRGVEI